MADVERRYPITIYEDYYGLIACPQIVMMANDNSNFLDFTLMKEEKAFTTTGYTATVEITRPDASTGTYGDIINTGIGFSWEMPLSALNQAGQFMCSLQIYKDGRRYTTYKFKYKVMAAVTNNADIIENEQYPVLTSLIKQTQDLYDKSMALSADNANAEMVAARKGETDLPTKIGKIDSQLANKALQTDLNVTNQNVLNNTNALATKVEASYVNAQIQSMTSVVQGFYATVSALTTAFPSGNANNYVVTADNYIYRWNGSTWASTGYLYGSNVPAPNSITPDMMSTAKRIIDDAKMIDNVPSSDIINKLTASTTPNTGNYLGSLAIKLSNQNIGFNLITIPFNSSIFSGESIDGTYAYCIVRKGSASSDVLEKHFKLFNGAGNYTFELSKVYNPSIDGTILIQIGLCTKDFMTLRSGIPYSSTSDSNTTNVYYLQINAGASVPITNTMTGTDATYYGFCYELKYQPNPIYRDNDSSNYRLANAENNITLNTNNIAYTDSKIDIVPEYSNLPSSDIIKHNEVASGTTISSSFKTWGVKFVKPASSTIFNIIQFYSTYATARYDLSLMCVVRDWNQNILEYKKIPLRQSNTKQAYTFVLDSNYDLQNGIIVSITIVDRNNISVDVGVNQATVTDSNVANIMYTLNTNTLGTLSTAGGGYYGLEYNLKYADKTSLIRRNVPINQTDNSKLFGILMPNNIYLLDNKELWFYDDNIVENCSLYEKMSARVELTSKVSGVTATDTYDLAPGRGKILGTKGHTATLSIKDYTGLTVSNKSGKAIISKDIVVNSKVHSTGKTINTLVVGDSFVQYMHNVGLLTRISQFAQTDGNTMQFVGTKTNDDGTLGEGRGGWTEHDYLTLYVPIAQRDSNATSESKKMPSPFVFSDDDTAVNSYFSMSKYMTNNSISQIDNIVFCLGMNGGMGTDINTMITKMKEALPNANFFVCLIPSHPKNLQFSSWTWNGNGIDGQLTRDTQNKSYMSLFDGRQAEKIYLAPTNANVHRINGFQDTTVNKFQFSDCDSTTEIINNGIHPTALGEKSIAYTIYDYLAYFNA